MTDATKILKTLTRQKVSRIREGRRTKTKERKGGGGWEKEPKTGSKHKLIRGKRKRWRRRKTRQPGPRRGLTNTSKGASRNRTP